ncbi:putative ABC transporter permease [uncultured Robinsoniella sp.]|uniref:putative ABC transporter permease n=1 Tax=uncultured Robinsoniella sp. TaxID=904190 RepID=UPI00374F8482
MWDFQILGVDLYHIMSWLYLYSFLGWLWESCYVSVKEKKIINRGFVTGPLCTIYGVGAMGVYLILRPLEDRLIILYLGGVLVATVLEYVTALLMETLFHTSWWDYSSKPYNFQGRICLGSSIAWGFFTVIMFKVFQPFAEWVVNLFSVPTGHAMVIIITILYVVDFTFSTLTAMKLGQKLGGLERAMGELVEYVQNTRIYSSAGELVDRLEPYRQSFTKQNVKEKMDQYQTAILKFLNLEGKEESLGEIKNKLSAVKDQYVKMASGINWNDRRLFRAYPNLSKATGTTRWMKKRSKKRNAKKCTLNAEKSCSKKNDDLNKNVETKKIDEPKQIDGSEK